jgi:hypothetical protein
LVGAYLLAPVPDVPRVTLFPNGVTASCPRFGPIEEPAKRGEIRGWSMQAAARLRRWFYGVDGPALDGHGYALTLTVRDLPPSAEDWTMTRKAFLDRMRRAGMVRGQWLTEWQRRGVPHLHGAVFFPEASSELGELVVDHWLGAAAEWSPGRHGQMAKELYGLPGWLQYQAKHSARGVRHYQRANVPQAWQRGTGRLWGYVGEWPLRELVLDVDRETFWRFRRLLRRWLLSRARSAGDQRRVTWLRRMLADPERSRCAVRAVGEFCPESVARELLMAAAAFHDESSGSPEPEPPEAEAEAA